MNEISAMSVRVLHIFGGMNRGGAEMRTLDIMRELNPREYQLDFCALSGQPGDLDQDIRALGGEVHFCKLGFTFPVKFVQLLIRQRYDVVHSHVWFVSGLVLFLARIASVPVRVAHFRTTGDQSSVGRVRVLRDSVLRGLIDRCATNILAVSEGAMQACWGQYRQLDDRCKTLYNGINLSPYHGELDADLARKELGVPSESNVYIHVGRFSPPKNHLRLVSIFTEVLSRDPSAVLLLVGGGVPDLEAQVRNKVNELGIASSVIFAGPRSDVPRLLKAANVMIFPSLWEGLPGSVIEACAAGLPVIASDLPGLREIQAHLPGVTITDLECLDEAWADVAVAAASVSPDNEAASRVDASVFSLHRSVDIYKAIWSRH